MIMKSTRDISEEEYQKIQYSILGWGGMNHLFESRMYAKQRDLEEGINVDEKIRNFRYEVKWKQVWREDKEFTSCEWSFDYK